MRVPYSYLEEQFKDPSAILADVEKLVKRGDFTLGKEVEAFEKGFTELTGAEYAVGVSSGTAGLHLLLEANDIKGGEVITTPNTFFATVNAIVAAGARPRFVDIGSDYNINPELIEGAINEDTRAIMPVHLTGRPAKMQAINMVADEYNLKVIEDSAQAIGAQICGTHVGNFSEGGAFSLHPLKNLNIWGDAGMIVTNNKDTYDRLNLLRNQGLSSRDDWAVYGWNLRIASLQACVGKHIINDAEPITVQRIANAKFYDEKLGEMEEVTLPPREDAIREVFHTYVFQTDRRDELHHHLMDNGIEAKVHYPIALHLQPATAALNYRKGDFPETEKQCERILTLPVHQHLNKKQLSYVVDTIKDFYTK